MNELKIQWHPAFCSAMELVLKKDREHLEFIREYNLNKKPLEVDLLVIKKSVGYEVTDEIGKIFKKHNLVEYKAPGDALNIDTFYKVSAYAALYKASSGSVNGISADSVTITLLRDIKPQKLFQDLIKEGFIVRNPFKGIYYVEGKTYFLTQVVVFRELTGKQYVWFQALTKQLKQERAETVIRMAQESRGHESHQLVDSVLAVIIKANMELFDKMKEDAKMCEALRELMADEINETINESRVIGERIGEKREKMKGLKALVDILRGMHLDFDSAYESIIKTEAYADISRKQVMEYWQ